MFKFQSSSSFLSPGLDVSKSASSFLSISDYISVSVQSNMSFWHGVHNLLPVFKHLTLLFSPNNKSLTRSLPAHFWSVLHVLGCSALTICCPFGLDKRLSRVLSKKWGVDVLCSGMVPYWDDAAKWRDLRGTVSNQAAVKARWEASGKRRSADIRWLFRKERKIHLYHKKITPLWANGLVFWLHNRIMEWLIEKGGGIWEKNHFLN